MSGILSAEWRGSGDHSAETGGLIPSGFFESPPAAGPSLPAYRAIYSGASDGPAGEKTGYRK